MKLLLFMIIFISSFKTSALEICDFYDIATYKSALINSGIKALRVTKNLNRLTALEKDMVHLTMSFQESQGGISRNEALNKFMQREESFSNVFGSSIVYYQIGFKTFALILFWQNQAEHGALYVLRGGAFKIQAKINDGIIDC